MFRIKNDIKNTNIMCTGSHKCFPTHCIHTGSSTSVVFSLIASACRLFLSLSSFFPPLTIFVLLRCDSYIRLTVSNCTVFFVVCLLLLNVLATCLVECLSFFLFLVHLCLFYFHGLSFCYVCLCCWICGGVSPACAFSC